MRYIGNKLIALLVIGCAAQAYAWPFVQFGSEYHEHALDLSLSPAGGLYLSGSTGGVLDPLGARQGSDGFVSRLAESGEVLWTRQLGSDGSDAAWAVEADHAGGVYVGGEVNGLFGESFLGGFNDSFLARFDSEGDELWRRQFGTDESEIVTSITVDSQNAAYVAGRTSGEMHLSGGGAAYDAYFRKYSPEGGVVWGRQFGTNGIDQTGEVVIGPNGDLYAVGSTTGDLFDARVGGHDVWVTRYSPDGDLIWSRQFGSPANDFGDSIVVNQAGEVFLSVYTDGDLGAANLGESDVALMKLDPNGDLLWTEQFGTEGDEVLTDLALDPQGNVFLAGWTQGGSFVGVASPTDVAYIALYNTAGKRLWLREFDADGPTRQRAVAVDDRGYAYFAGGTEATLGAASFGNYDAFVGRVLVPEPVAALLAAMGLVACPFGRFGQRDRRLD